MLSTITCSYCPTHPVGNREMRSYCGGFRPWILVQKDTDRKSQQQFLPPQILRRRCVLWTTHPWPEIAVAPRGKQALKTEHYWRRSLACPTSARPVSACRVPIAPRIYLYRRRRASRANQTPGEREAPAHRYPSASMCTAPASSQRHPPASCLLQSSACDSAACKNQQIPKALKGKMVSSGRHRTSERSRASHRVRCPIPRQVTP